MIFGLKWKMQLPISKISIPILSKKRVTQKTYNSEKGESSILGISTFEISLG